MMAFNAWLTAPAPIACTSTKWCSRITPAIAPATPDVRDDDDTLSGSILHTPVCLRVITPPSIQRYNQPYIGEKTLDWPQLHYRSYCHWEMSWKHCKGRVLMSENML